jgi:hypothetical protein
MKKASTVLGGRIAATKKNIKKMMADAGCPEYKTVKVLFSNVAAASGDDVVTLGLNGIVFYFKRGESVDLPQPLAEIASNCYMI